jgi:Amt family ammonium transporter
VLGSAAGAVAGLVAITPAAGFVTVPASIIIGLGAGGICFFGVHLVKQRFGVDDALDVVGVHGLGGTWGALATGLFATIAINSAGANGLLYGNPQQLLTQLLAVAASWIYASGMTFVILKAIDALIGLRVPEDEEVLGLDTTQHGEVAYQL